MLEVERIALEITDRMEAVVEAIARRRRSLADQADRAAECMALNVAEALGRIQRDRTHQLRIAYASGRELRFALLIAQRRRYIGDEPELMALIDRELGLIYGLHRKLSGGADGSAGTPSPPRDR